MFHLIFFSFLSTIFKKTVRIPNFLIIIPGIPQGRRTNSGSWDPNGIPYESYSTNNNYYSGFRIYVPETSSYEFRISYGSVHPRRSVRILESGIIFNFFKSPCSTDIFCSTFSSAFFFYLHTHRHTHTHRQTDTLNPLLTSSKQSLLLVPEIWARSKLVF